MYRFVLENLQVFVSVDRYHPTNDATETVHIDSVIESLRIRIADSLLFKMSTA